MAYSVAFPSPRMEKIVGQREAEVQNGLISNETYDVNEKKLMRKIDWRIIPLMFFCYLLQFLDKVLINVRFFLILKSSGNTAQLTLTVCERYGRAKRPTYGRPGLFLDGDSIFYWLYNLRVPAR